MSRSLSHWFPERERGTAHGVMFMGSRLGGAVTPLLVTPILAYAGWALGDRVWIERDRIRHQVSDRLRTRSAHAAVRGMPAHLGTIPVRRRRLIEHAYFGGLTHIQLARLLPSPA